MEAVCERRGQTGRRTQRRGRHDNVPDPPSAKTAPVRCQLRDNGASNENCHIIQKGGSHDRSCHSIWDVSASGLSCHETGGVSATLAVNRLGRCRVPRLRSQHKGRSKSPLSTPFPSPGLDTSSYHTARTRVQSRMTSLWVNWPMP